MPFLTLKNTVIKCCSVILLFLFSGFANPVNAQVNNNLQSWNIIGVKWPVNQKWTIGYSHNFLRWDDFYGDHNQMFGDLTVAYKLQSNISFQFLNRFVLIPGENNNANWIFIDANYVWKKEGSPLSIKNRLRLHYGAEWVGDFEQGDFLRYALIFNYKASEKFTPFLSAEPFFQLNGRQAFQRNRYELGTRWKIAPRWTLTGAYRIDDFVGDGAGTSWQVIVLHLSYRI